MHQVFVYGSLRQGHGNHGLIQDSRLVSDEVELIGAEMYSLGPYPAITGGDDVVKGELYEVDDRTLHALDRLEGHPFFYKREQHMVQVKGVDERMAWVYFFQDGDRLDALNRVHSGDWNDVRTPNRQAFA